MGIQYTSRIELTKQMIREEARGRVREAVEILRKYLALKLSNKEGRTGRQYRVPGTNRFYMASAPGEYPALRTGALHKGVQEGGVTVTHHGARFAAHMTVKLPPYGAILEAGLRPWLKRASKEKWREMTAVLRRKWF